MGGVSGLAGGTRLSRPLECAATARAQVLEENRILVRCADNQVEVEASTWLEFNADQASKYLEEHNALWAARTFGALRVLRDEKLLPSSTWGLRLHLDSDVPLGAGVSSRASMSVATLRALGAAFEFHLSGERTARLARQAEPIAGAACSVADFKIVARAKRDQLLHTKCQPALVEGLSVLPRGVQVLGVDSGARHFSDALARWRIGAAMGQRILSELIPSAMRGADNEMYLANIGSDIWRALRDRIPISMRGGEFLDRYGSHQNTATIQADEEYTVRLATEHPIYEAERAVRFWNLLHAAQSNPGGRHEILLAAGELMIQSHFSYGHRCNLDSPETDILVSLARAAGPKSGVYGARVSGARRGRHSCVLDRRCGQRWLGTST
jgi:galactokinase